MICIRQNYSLAFDVRDDLCSAEISLRKSWKIYIQLRDYVCSVEWYLAVELRDDMCSAEISLVVDLRMMCFKQNWNLDLNSICETKKLENVYSA